MKKIMNDRVIVVTKEEDMSTFTNELLVKMHAGLWATCYDLSGKYTHYLGERELTPWIKTKSV